MNNQPKPRRLVAFLLAAVSSFALVGCGDSDREVTYRPNAQGFEILAWHSYAAHGWMSTGAMGQATYQLVAIVDSWDDPSLLQAQDTGGTGGPDSDPEMECLMANCQGPASGPGDNIVCEFDCDHVGTRLSGSVAWTFSGAVCDVQYGDTTITCDIKPGPAGYSGTFEVVSPGGASRTITWTNVLLDQGWECPAGGEIEVRITTTDRGDAEQRFVYPTGCPMP